MNDLYREIIIDHYRNPRNFGSLKKPTFFCERKNTLCGDKIRIELKVNNKTDKIEDVKFTGEGCAICMASTSMLTEAIKGEKVSNLKTLKKDDIVNMLSINLSPVRLKCALLCLETLRLAIKEEE